MDEKKEPTLTSAEVEVMNAIWQQSPVAVPDIVERLPRSLAYTTVLTTVRILEEKGFVARCGKQGRAFLYQARIARDEVRGSMLRQLANRLFGGSIKSMVLNLVQDEGLADNDLADLKQFIQELESKQ